MREGGRGSRLEETSARKELHFPACGGAGAAAAGREPRPRGVAARFKPWRPRFRPRRGGGFLFLPREKPQPGWPGSDGGECPRGPGLFWGSYRPHVYLGMKTRSPRAPVTGLMWLLPSEGEAPPPPLRHTCEQSDRLAGYGWLRHDGLTFGLQEIRDRGLRLRTEFVKRPGGLHGGDWSWRVTARPERSAGPPPAFISLLFYVATDGQGILRPLVVEKNRLASLTGTTEELGDFTITFLQPTSEAGTGPLYASYNYLHARAEGLHRLSDVVKASLSPRFVYAPPGGPKRRYAGVDTYQGPPDGRERQSQLVVHQVTVALPCRLEMAFESGSVSDRAERLVGEVLTQELASHVAAFDQRFEEAFGLARKGFSAQEQDFAKAAFSNMLGGMGYFYGRSLVQSPHSELPQPYPEGPLFTAVPSRSFFPRGFLWDEGFHQLLLSRWDPALSCEVLAHWFDLMNAEGWIPREQILGEEARTKVPAEFVVQHSSAGNPPTFFLLLQQLLAQGAVDAPYLRSLFPRLQSWYDWYNRTQAGPVPYTFRWHGRDQDTQMFLNPKTLTSGLDDYPRASHPSPEERHLDLRCWMALASDVMAQVAVHLGEPAGDYQHMAKLLADNQLLEQHHWAKALSTFADYGNHTQAVALEWEKPRPPSPGQPLPPPRLLRVVRKPPRLQFVGGALGYVSLFPLLLQLLRPDSPHLGTLLADMRSEKQLWTPFGLRSLSRSSPLYLKYNTEHDPPYWRGAIWININYLAVRALHHYGRQEGPFRQEAASLYQELRANLVGNVFQQYQESGYLWEQYHDGTGKGQGSHPFTGWSALVVLMMSEKY
ncbi:mannosyl-oligosaccharide glucosidase isoform X1 [Sphaerodactylus townsendi]|uniref:mannosyl-oligosaccharide glucosidase isoform X1 n=1 Tax=Sphaerodactylus townsendi TaxID=933632 RepID=UPI002025C172|nr:mannosyl-oligosaccharide glucosidase isoform X1 [Sphaerodactylus townsendi]